MSTSAVPGDSANAEDEVVAELRNLLPAAFPDGVLDAEALLASLGLTVDDTRQSFNFGWPGIELARSDARSATTATLSPDVASSVDWEAARDVLIEGDNLQALKLLLRGYSRQAKLIYIDPPYNTEETFVYNDSYTVAESEYLTSTGQVDEQGQALSSKIETAGRKHAPWLNMIFPRLAVARHLLRRDGVILVSIDNNEVHHLRMILDAVFGAANFVDMMTWRGARKGDGKLTAGGQDYILVYARDLAHLKANDVRWREDKTGLQPIYDKVAELREQHGEDYQAITDALRSWYKSLAEEDPSRQHDYYDIVDDKGIWFSDNISSPNYRENLIYDWKGYSPPANGWRYEKSTMERLDAEGRLIYPEDKTKRVKIKSYLHMHEQWAPASVFYRDRRAASSVVKGLLGEKVFDNPKNTEVLARLFHSMTTDGDLIIDFFAGSGSTGHAVWEQNIADGKTRHWVLVQAPESIDTSNETGKTAAKQGYKNIFEITLARLQKASEALSSTAKPGLRVFRLRPTSLHIDPPVVATAEMTGDGYVQAALDTGKLSPVVDGADPLAVAWEVALKTTATQLDAAVVEHDVDDIKVYEFLPAGVSGVTSGRLFVSLDGFTLATADAMAVGDSDTVIVRGDLIDDSTSLTLGPRCRLVLLERVSREVSL